MPPERVLQFYFALWLRVISRNPCNEVYLIDFLRNCPSLKDNPPSVSSCSADTRTNRSINDPASLLQMFGAVGGLVAEKDLRQMKGSLPSSMWSSVTLSRAYQTGQNLAQVLEG